MFFLALKQQHVSVGDTFRKLSKMLIGLVE